MDTKNKIWCELIKHIPNQNTSASFFNEFNNQLKQEFYHLTGKEFDEKRWYLFIENPDEIEYINSTEFPFARLLGVLMFTRGRLDVSIVWFDKINKVIHRPDEDISSIPLEFHWENLNINSPSILNLAYSIFDLRTKYHIDVEFPINSISSFIGTDTTVIFELISKTDSPKLDLILQSIRNSWNNIIDSNKQIGVIHSIHKIDENNKKISFSFDTGSASEVVYKYIFEELVKHDVSIKSVEIING